ncbi:MAG TPA: translation initiation factor IF-2 [Candidatus Paceibacterota bacterium]
MNTETSKKIPRPPIVVIMGHIDHGKSSLLDYIRKTKVVDKEAGGITQHISAYEAIVELGKGEKRSITFLDTPGHEAFHSVRKSGSKVADIAVVIVSAEDGVKQQTIEVLDRVKEDKIPFIIAINKIDKPNANIDKTKQELAEKEIFVEGWGGTVPFVPISAKTGEGVEELLETILLQGDMEELTGDPLTQASGFVIESNRDSRKGVVATLIIRNGTLKKGMFVSSGSCMAPVRMIEDFIGKVIDTASLSKPIRLNGWDNAPAPGSLFMSHLSKQEAEKAVEEYLATSKNTIRATEDSSVEFIPVAIKADTLGSLSAIEHEFKKMNTEKIIIKIISSGVGLVQESDVKLGMASQGTLIVGFGVKVDGGAKDLALRNNVEVKTFDIIYELTDWVKNILIERTPKEEVDEITGTAKILKVFSVNKNKQVVGGKVESGEIKVNDALKIIRREVEIGEGRVRELQTQKNKTSLVNEGLEFGTLIESKIEIAPGDKIAAHSRVTR